MSTPGLFTIGFLVCLAVGGGIAAIIKSHRRTGIRAGGEMALLVIGCLATALMLLKLLESLVQEPMDLIQGTVIYLICLGVSLWAINTVARFYAWLFASGEKSSA